MPPYIPFSIFFLSIIEGDALGGGILNCLMLSSLYLFSLPFAVLLSFPLVTFLFHPGLNFRNDLHMLNG